MFWFYFWIIILIISFILAIILSIGPSKIHNSSIFGAIVVILFFISRIGIFISDETYLVLPYFLNFIIGIPVLILGIIIGILAEIQIKFDSFSGAAEGKTLITKGIYGKIRHPIYLSEILWPIGLVLIMGRFLSIFVVIVCAICLLAYIPIEEQNLIRVHGDKYKEYKKQVPMIFPIKIRRKT